MPPPALRWIRLNMLINPSSQEMESAGIPGGSICLDPSSFGKIVM